MQEFWNEIIQHGQNLGIGDIGCSKWEQTPINNCPYAISIVVPLSGAIIDEIKDAPTYSYFQHYRTVNAFIDRSLLEIGLILQKYQYRYYPIPASQSIPEKNGLGFQGRFSHKQAAVEAGLGGIGKNNLFLHPKWGPRVRLGTIFTDAPLPVQNTSYTTPCIECNRCVNACPADALRDIVWVKGSISPIDAMACSSYMKQKYQKIGRGAVCGICMAVCPIHKKI